MTGKTSACEEILHWDVHWKTCGPGLDQWTWPNLKGTPGKIISGKIGRLNKTQK